MLLHVSVCCTESEGIVIGRLCSYVNLPTVCVVSVPTRTHTLTHTHTHTAKPVVDNVQTMRLCADDFETIELIGKGAFGEVKVSTLT